MENDAPPCSRRKPPRSVTEPGALRSKVKGDLGPLQGRFQPENKAGTLRIDGASGRRLELIFEEGADVTRETVNLLAELQRGAGSVRLEWWVYKSGYRIPSVEYMKKFLGM